ncbi:hypothetical protein LINPERPRIM_LOCUS11695, partial [Linum perenne]
WCVNFSDVSQAVHCGAKRLIYYWNITGFSNLHTVFSKEIPEITSEVRRE